VASIVFPLFIRPCFGWSSQLAAERGISAVGVPAATNEYRIEPIGAQFIVVDPWGEMWTDTLRKKKRGKISNGAREYAISDKAHLLVENAIKALMQLKGVDRDTAERAIREVMGGA
jgi:hypothetical protein